MKDRKALLAEAASVRNAASSQRADLMAGNFPAKLDRTKLEKHVSDLEQKADDLERQAHALPE